MSNKLLKQTDLKVIRSYTYKGIRIFLELDYMSKKVAIVEYDTILKDFVPKNFKFASRPLEYMEGWKMVYKALELVTEEAIKELENIKEKELDNIIDALLRMPKINLDNK